MARTSKRYLQQESAKKGQRKQYFVALYSRLSVDVDEGKCESIENQIQIMEQYIESANADLREENEFLIYHSYIDIGKTGTNFNREGFESMMHAVRQGQVNCIMVKDFSRFGRDYIETGNYIEKILPFLGVRFISVGDQFDSMSDTANKNYLTMNIKNLVNEMYAKDISQKVLLCKQLDKENRSYLGRAPYGYKIKEIDARRTLSIDEETSKVVFWIFEQYANGILFEELIQQLYEKKIHRISDYLKYGHVYYQEKTDEILHQWKKSVLAEMLNNSIYIGTLTQGKYSWIHENDKKIRKMNPSEEWIVTEHAHPAIISDELFQQVSRRLVKEKRDYKRIELNHIRRKSNEEENIFSNVMYCGDCGKKLRARYYQSQSTGIRKYSYYCKGSFYIDERKCCKKMITESKLSELFLEAVRIEFSKNDLKGNKFNRLSSDCVEELSRPYKAEREEIVKQQKIWKRKAVQMYQSYKEGDIHIDEYEQFRIHKRMNEQYFRKRLEEIHQKIQELDICIQEEKRYLQNLLQYKHITQSNRTLVESLVSKIKLYGDGVVEIEFRFTGGVSHGNERLTCGILSIVGGG